MVEVHKTVYGNNCSEQLVDLALINCLVWLPIFQASLCLPSSWCYV